MSEVPATTPLQNTEIKHVRFVRPDGRDSNDGKSWFSAKETVLAAYDDIPEGDGGGVIYIAHQSKIGSQLREGIWIVGNSDPIFRTLGVSYHDFDGRRDMSVDRHGRTHEELRGWRKEKKVLFKGVGGAKPVAYGSPGAAQIGPDFRNGNNRFILNDNYPAIWLSAVAELAFEDLIINNRSVGIRIGVTVQDREPVLDGRAVVTGYITFRRVYVDVVGQTEASPPALEELPPELRPPHGDPNQVHAYVWTHIGPGVEIEWGLWVKFDNCVFVNSSLDAATYDPSVGASQHGYSDRHAGILVRKKFASSAAILFVSDCIFKNGNLKYYAGHPPAVRGPFSFHVSNCIVESVWQDGDIAYNPPGVHLIYPDLLDGAALIENLGLGDVGKPSRMDQPQGAVFIEGAKDQNAESIVCINTLSVTGPATIINNPAPREWQNQKKTLAAKNQVGFWQGRVAAQHDSARRTFGPVSVRFKNLMPQDPQDIARLAQPGIGAPHPILNANVLAPDGTYGAFNLSPNPTSDQGLALQSKSIYCRRLRSQDVNVGDIIIAGVWARAASKNGFLPFITALVTAGFSDYEYILEGWHQSTLSLKPPLRGDGEWEWLCAAGKLSHKSVRDEVNLMMAFFCKYGVGNNPTYSHDFYAPILLHISKDAGLSDNEMNEMCQHLSSWPDNVEVGTVALLRGQDFALQGHFISRGSMPRMSSQYGMQVHGNDTSGVIGVSRGNAIDSDGTIATLIFIKSFPVPPCVILTAANRSASTLNAFVKSFREGFSIMTTDTTLGNPTEDPEWNYFVIDT